MKPIEQWRYGLIHRPIRWYIHFPRSRVTLPELGRFICSLDEEPGYGLFGDQSGCSIRDHLVYGDFRHVVTMIFNAIDFT